MSTTAYWEAVRPTGPLGSWSQLKWLVWEDENPAGAERVIEVGDRLDTWLRGYLAALPESDERRAELAEFLDHLAEHKALRVWIAE